jgi:enoyl-CoA hydratase/carnithine racemase
MLRDLTLLVGELEAEDTTAVDATRVMVMRSADPDFFIAHADLGLIKALPATRGRIRRSWTSSPHSSSGGARCRK